MGSSKTIAYQTLKEQSPYLKNNKLNRGQFVMLIIIQDLQNKYGSAYKGEILRKISPQYYNKKYAYSILTDLRDKGVVEQNGPEYRINSGDFEAIKKLKYKLYKMGKPSSTKKTSEIETKSTWKDLWQTFTMYFLPFS